MSSFERLRQTTVGACSGAVEWVLAGRRMPAPAVLAVGFTTAAGLAGCGLVEVENARLEAEAVGREVAAYRELAPKPGLSVVRVVESRPYVGFERVESDARLGLPAQFREADAVTVPLAGFERATVFAARIESATGLTVQLGRVAVAEGGGGKGKEGG